MAAQKRRVVAAKLGTKLLLGIGIFMILLAIAGVMLEPDTYARERWGMTAGTALTGMGLVMVYLVCTTRKKVFEVALILLVILFYILFFHLLGWL